MDTQEKYAIGLLDESNVPSFYDAARSAELEDATVPTNWSEKAKTTKNISDISQIIGEQMKDITSAKDADVFIVADQPTLDRLGLKPGALEQALDGYFAGRVTYVAYDAGTLPSIMGSTVAI